MGILSGKVTVKIDMSPSENGSTLEGKDLLPLGANSFLLEQTPFQKETSKHVTNRQSQKLSTLAEMQVVSAVPLTQVVSRVSSTVVVIW